MFRHPRPLAAALGLSLAFALLALWRWGLTPQAWALLPLLIVLALSLVSDLRANVIPDVLTLPGIAYALVLAGALRHPPLWEALVGGLVGGGVVLVMAVVSRGGVGGGDVKLMVMVGIALGWKGALAVLALSQLAGGLMLLGFLMVHRRRMPSALPVGALMSLLGALGLLGR